MSRPFATDDAFRAVADPARRRILDLLRGGDRTVTELTRLFKMSQPTMSYHLRVLRITGLVSQRRSGRSRVYRLNAAPLTPVCQWAMRYE